MHVHANMNVHVHVHANVHANVDVHAGPDLLPAPWHELYARMRRTRVPTTRRLWSRVTSSIAST